MRLLATVIGTSIFVATALPVVAATLPGVGTYEGVAGIGTSNGDVGNSPLGKDYVYVTTAGSSYLGAGLGIGQETTGSVLTTSSFSAAVGEKLDLYFNYVTTDGTPSFVEYAYVLLNDLVNNTSLTLFTARTTPSGNTVPGFGLPALAAGVTLNPASTPIIDGLTNWSELGDDSGQCYGGLGAGCGQTGWVQALYDFEAVGQYSLTFGVVNWGDQNLQSGLAVAGAKVGDTIIVDPNPGPSPVPLPAGGVLILTGLGAIAALRRRRG